MKEFTREELSTLKRTERGAHVCNNHEEGKIYYLREIHGSQAYLDCQSTLSIDMSLPFHNFDLSQITDETECDTLGGGVTGIQDYPKLYAALAARGYDEPLLSALFSGNWLRVLPKE